MLMRAGRSSDGGGAIGPIERDRQSLGRRCERQLTTLPDERHKLPLIDRIAGAEREPADLSGHAGAEEHPVWVGHEHAVLETEMDVLGLRCDVAEVPRLSTTVRHVVADQPPSRPDSLDRVRDRPADDCPKALGDRAHRLGVGGEQRLRWQRIHAAIIADRAPGRDFR